MPAFLSLHFSSVEAAALHFLSHRRSSFDQSANPILGGKKEFVVLIHLPTQLVTNGIVNNHLRYEKRNDTECCIIGRGSDVRFVLELDARDDDNHNASNHGHGPATYYWRADNDNNDARGHWRLLIAKAGRGCVYLRHGPLRAVFALNSR
jgi:hypothetical protein